MANSKESSMDNEDLTNFKNNAAAALEKIRETYIDIMGCRNTTVNNYYFESDSDTTFSIPNVREFQNYSNSNINCAKNNSSTYVCKTCIRCQKPVLLPGKILHLPDYTHPNLEAYNSPCEFKSDFSSSTASSMSQEFYAQLNYNEMLSNRKKQEIYRWDPKITVPEPFQMTIRDEATKEFKELKQKQLKEKLEKEEEKQLNIRFHSRPIPSHVYAPLYKEMAEFQAKQKDLRKQMCSQKMKEMVKPFNFSSPVKRQRLPRSDSMPDLSKCETPFIFKAKPAPKYVLSRHVSEKLKNREIMRKLEISRRAQELLRQSSLPFSSKRPLKRSLSVVNIKLESQRKHKKTTQNSKKVISAMSHEQCKAVMRDWNTKVSSLLCQTTVKEEKSEVRYKEFLQSKTQALSDVPVRMTAASLLREKEIRKEFLEKDKHKVRKQPYSHVMHKKTLKHQLKNHLKSTALPGDFKDDIEEKLQSYRASGRTRQMEYNQELEEIMKRIECQPLLIERQSKAVAAKGDKQKTQSKVNKIAYGASEESDQHISQPASGNGSFSASHSSSSELHISEHSD